MCFVEMDDSMRDMLLAPAGAPTCTIDGADPSTAYTISTVGVMGDGQLTAASPPFTVSADPPPPLITSAVQPDPGIPDPDPAPAGTAPIVSGSERAFTAVTPERVFDTRLGEAGLRPVTRVKVGGAQILEVKLTDLVGARGTRLVPAAAVGAVSLNVTATDAVGAGFVTVFPCGQRNVVSSLNVAAGATVANAVIAPVSAAGTVCFYSSVDTNLLADINGWFASGQSFSPVAPDRLFDTRVGQAGLRAVGKTKVGAHPGADGVLEVPVTDLVGAGGGQLVPAWGVGAVSLNLTATDAVGEGVRHRVPVWPAQRRLVVEPLRWCDGCQRRDRTGIPVRDGVLLQLGRHQPVGRRQRVVRGR